MFWGIPKRTPWWSEVSQLLDFQGADTLAIDTIDEERAPILLSRAMIKIQEGCNQVCAYCIVPKVRGRERSIPPRTLVSQVNYLVARGYKEVVLTGTQLGSYGFDIPGASLTDMLRRLLDETAIPRLRVSSLQPQEITDELLELWQEERLCPHFHLPLQSGSEPVLKQMRRRYSPGRYLEAVRMVRTAVPHAALTADVIVGFPGETVEQFQDTYDLCKRGGFRRHSRIPLLCPARYYSCISQTQSRPSRSKTAHGYDAQPGETAGGVLQKKPSGHRKHGALGERQALGEYSSVVRPYG